MILEREGIPKQEARQLSRYPQVAQMAIESARAQRANDAIGGLVRGAPPLPGMGGRGGAPTNVNQPPRVGQAPRPSPFGQSTFADAAIGTPGAASMVAQPMPTLNPQQTAGFLPAARDAIASIESAGSGDYQAVGPTHPRMGRALGRYQVMEANIPQWSREALGQEITSEQFLSSPELQDKIFDHRFGGYVQRFGSLEDAASAWFTGRPLAEGANRKDVLGTSGSGYVNRFTQAFNRFSPQGSAQGQPLAPNRVQMASLGGVPAGVNLDGLPPGPVPSTAPPMPPRQPAGRPTIDEEAPGGFPPSGGLLQTAQAAGALPTMAQPPIRNIGPVGGMPSVDAFNRPEQMDWQAATAQLEPKTVQQAQRSVSRPPPPSPEQARGPRTTRDTALKNVEYWTNAMIVASQFGDRGKGIIEAAKQRLDIAKEYLKPTEIEKKLDAMGLPEGSPLRSQIIMRSFSDNRPTSVQTADELLASDPDRASTIREVLKLGQQQVNIGQSETGAIPPGWEMINTPEGRTMRPVKDGPADLEMRRGRESAGRQQTLTARQILPTIDDIQTARDLASSRTLGFFPRTGMLSGILKRIPGAGQATVDLEASIDAIGSGISLENLNQMRQSSPTGGALGNVSDKQSSLLSEAFGSLRQSQSEPLFLYNLARVENVLNDIVHGEGNGPKRHDLLDMREKLRRHMGINSPDEPMSAAGTAPAAPPEGGDGATIPKGATATNPQTGEKIQFDGQKWVPVK
jgi:hypothetical protein